MTGTCRRCGWQPIRATKQLCSTCWDYQNRTGKARPPEVILRHLNRSIDKDRER